MEHQVRQEKMVLMAQVAHLE
jgi:hypothetical protein